MDIDAAPEPEVMTRSRARRARRRMPLGLVALAVVLGVIVLEAVGVGLAVHGQYAVATLIGHAVIALTAVTFVVGAVAVVSGRGRRSGIAAAVLSVLANPLVLNWLLGLFEGA